MPSEAEQIAKDLTEGERAALLAAVECKGGKWWTPYARAFGRDTTLQRSGVLNETGLAVRAVLVKEASYAE